MKNKPETLKKYYEANKEYIKGLEKTWRENNRERIKEWGRKHLREHRDAEKKFRKTIKGKLYHSRSDAKHRGLGNEILIHRPFPDNITIENHHITIDYMIPIPKELHHSVPHNVRTGEGMDEINLKVLEYLRK